MGRKAGVTVEQTRTDLLAAAARVFARKGYDGASIADICAEAGLSTGPVYAHYVFRNKLRETVTMGRPSGPCGTFEATRRQIPVKARTGTWLLQFDQKPTYSDPPDAVFVQLQIRVFRDFPG
jgi:AcrR family transcriptional regulator